MIVHPPRTRVCCRPWRPPHTLEHPMRQSSAASGTAAPQMAQPTALTFVTLASPNMPLLPAPQPLRTALDRYFHPPNDFRLAIKPSEGHICPMCVSVDMSSSRAMQSWLLCSLTFPSLPNSAIHPHTMHTTTAHRHKSQWSLRSLLDCLLAPLPLVTTSSESTCYFLKHPPPCPLHAIS